VEIKHLTLSKFRNHDSTEVAFHPGVNLFAGDNGQGKTNLVEAVHYLATLNSHRTAGYIPLINWDSETAVIRARVAHAGREVLLDVELSRNNKNRVSVNRSATTRTRDILGYVQTVTFAPEDLDIVKKDPGNRRKFIDDLLVQLSPKMAGVISDYERVLKQRNALLKSARANGVKGAALSTLDAWDSQLLSLGSKLIAARGILMERLNPIVESAYAEIAVTRNKPKIAMKSSIVAVGIPGFGDDEESESLDTLENFEEASVLETFEAKLKEVRTKELDRGLTLIGPQRDDLVLLLNGMPAKTYASHGEGWSYALALKLASRELLKLDGNFGDPILILDDVFAELDAKRRDRLATLVMDNEQVLITAAVAEDVPESLKAKMFHVEHGVVTNG
jgi:DNA replication and repair protein RecF